ELCKAVYYCSSRCKEIDFLSEPNPDHGHHLWCSKMKAFMSVESRLCDLPLAFARVTTLVSFSDNQMAQFLTAHGVYNMGLWKYEHPFGALEPSVKAAGPPDGELHLFCALWNTSTLDTPHHDPRCNVWSESSSATVSSEDAMLRAYSLPMESILLSLSPTVPQTLEARHSTLAAVFLSNWAEYYIWRGFANPSPSQSLHGDWSEFSSPMAILLHWPLTIYYVLAHIFPKTSTFNSFSFIPVVQIDGFFTCLSHALLHGVVLKYFISLNYRIFGFSVFADEQIIQSVFEKGVLTIHVVGVEHELSMLPVFLVSPSRYKVFSDVNTRTMRFGLELAYLLNPDLRVRLFFIGTDFSPAVDRHIFNLSSRLSVSVCSSTYHEFIRDSLPHLDRPHLVIGFNSGLAAYSTWTPTLKLIHALNVPAYFTDSCLYSCAWGYRVAHCLGVGVDEYHPECGTVLDDLEGTGVSAPILNPFRSPIRLQSSGARWGWFRNAFIYAPIRRTVPSTHPQGETIGQVIDQYAKLLGQQERFAPKAQRALLPGMRFSDVYEFLAALLLNRPLPYLNEASSGVVLDLVLSLAELLELLQNGDVGAFPELAVMRKALEVASTRVTDCTGIFLATAAAIHLAASLNATGEDLLDDSMSILPLGPLFVLREVQRTTSLKATRELQRVLLRKFCEIWELPEIEDNLNSLSVSTSPTNPVFAQLVKSLSMFTLNPFLLPRSVINSFQSLLCKLCRQTYSRSVDVSQLTSLFKSVLFSDLQLQPKTADPEDDVPTPSVPPQTKQQKKRCYEMDPSCDEPSVTPTKRVRRSRRRTTSTNQTVEVTGTANAVASAPTLSSSSTVMPLQMPKTGELSQFFRRVQDEREKLVNRKTYQKAERTTHSKRFYDVHNRKNTGDLYEKQLLRFPAHLTYSKLNNSVGQNATPYNGGTGSMQDTSKNWSCFIKKTEQR
ncbi:hypothetical protein X801_04593, partial [Opisthorchis viverrini]